ncbi:YncE family protein [Streptomyces sp. NPDC056707]|uniref:YncE family protein n=1 Tax=Streptomyces sp. NPDC056707 TaxID=3345919 RepID=UPI0036C0043B
MTATLIGSLTLIGAGAVTATAEETSVALPSSSFRDIVVDGVHDRVFVSDPTGGSIVVTDYTGAVVQQITAEEGAAGLVLSADSSKLYVALSTVDAIADAPEELQSAPTVNAPAATRCGGVLAGGRGRFRTADICFVSSINWALLHVVVKSAVALRTPGNRGGTPSLISAVDVRQSEARCSPRGSRTRPA